MENQTNSIFKSGFNPVAGFWKGKWGKGNDRAVNDYIIIFRNDGTMEVFNGKDIAGSSKATGNFFIKGSSVFGSYIYEGESRELSIQGNADDRFTTIEGSWNEGNFFLVKRNGPVPAITLYEETGGEGDAVSFERGSYTFESPVFREGVKSMKILYEYDYRIEHRPDGRAAGSGRGGDPKEDDFYHSADSRIIALREDISKLEVR